MLDPEEPGHFGFEMKQGALRGGVCIEIGEASAEQIVEFRGGVLRFGDQIDQFDEIRGQREPGVVGAQVIVRFDQRHLPETMEIAFATAGYLDFTQMKQIEQSAEATPGAARSFGDGLQFSFRLREPSDDEARFREPNFSQKDGLRGLQVL